MNKTFLALNRTAVSVLPRSVDDFVPSDHPARFIVDVVSRLDVSSIRSKYKPGGKRAYPPEMLVALLLYGYAHGTHSSRGLEKQTQENLAYMFIADGHRPDHDTIATFRRRFGEELKSLFLHILEVAQELGVLQLGRVHLDGTKLKANASKHKAMSYKYAIKRRKKLRAEVDAMLASAERRDQEEAPLAAEIQTEVALREVKLESINRAIRSMESRAAERHAVEQTEYERKMADRKALEESGRKPRGSPPAEPSAQPRDTDQVNFTDEQSRIMKTSRGFEQCYNGQAGVDEGSHLIVTRGATNAANDVQQMEPALEQLQSQSPTLGKATGVVADAGYYSKNNVNKCSSADIPVYISKTREHSAAAISPSDDDLESPGPTGDPMQDMALRMRTTNGKRIYAKRKATVETVFGVIKNVMKFRQFGLRGLLGRISSGILCAWRTT